MDTTTVLGPRGLRLLVEVPTTRRERARGLRGRSSVDRGEAMLFERCRSVHTFGMRLPIRVAALDSRLRVYRVSVLRPRRLLLPRRGVRHILECALDADVRPGDRFVREAQSERRRGEAPTALRRSRR